MISEDFHDIASGSIIHSIFLKQSEDGDKIKQMTFTLTQLSQVKIDPTYKVVMYYNMSCCY